MTRAAESPDDSPRRGPAPDTVSTYARVAWHECMATAESAVAGYLHD